MSNVLMWKKFKAEGAIKEHHIVEFHNAGIVKQADNRGDKVIGVSGRGDVADGGDVEVALIGIADIKADGVVNRGDLVRASATANKTGQAAVAENANDRVVGVALETSSDGDFIPVLLSQGVVK